MKLHPFLAYSFFSTALILGASADDKTLSESQKESIIQKLEQLLDRREAGTTSGSTIAIGRLKAAAANDSAAIGFYSDCVKMERFERDKKKGGEYSKWKQDHADTFRTNAARTCIRANAMGLVSALQVAAADKAKPDQKEAAFVKTLPDFHSFLDLASAGIAQADALEDDKEIKNYSKIWEQTKKIKDLDLVESEVANALNITAYIRAPEGFPRKLPEALDANENFLLPRLYEFGNLSTIDQAWNRHIQRLADGVNFYKKEKLIAKSKDIFEERLPLARWAQARDRFRYGTDKVAGATAMLDVIKAHLDHEFCVTWIEEFKALVEEDAPGAGESASR